MAPDLRADQLVQEAYSRLPDGHVRARHGHRFDAAQVCAEQALLLAPEHPGALYVRGLAQLDRHDFHGALASARRVLALRPDRVAAHLLASDAHLELGQLRDAEAALAHALAINPTGAALVRAAHLRHLRHDDAGAKALYRRALLSSLRGGDRSVALWAALETAELLLSERDAEGARAGFDWVLSQAPDSARAQRGRSRACAAAAVSEAGSGACR